MTSGWWWPELATREECVAAIRRGAWAGTVVIVLTAGMISFGAVSRLGGIDVGITAVLVTWLVTSRDRTPAVLLVAMFLAEKVMQLQGNPRVASNPWAMGVAAVILLLLIGAARATFSLAERASDAPGALPISAQIARDLAEEAVSTRRSDFLKWTEPRRPQESDGLG